MTTAIESIEKLVFDENSGSSTVPAMSAAERALLREGAGKGLAGFECFNCGYVCKFGELCCPQCLTLFATGAQTHKLNNQVTHYQPDQKAPIGEVFVEAQQTITFHIDGQQLVLPTRESLVIGRLSEVPGDKTPDINLSAFKTLELGVSRQHIQITRIRELVYVTDLGSSNGTFLNGHRLTPNCKRLLRNGDELRLGRLKVRIAFSQNGV